MDATSATLLGQLRTRDHPTAWPRFVRLYTPLLLRWAARAGVPVSDQHDLVQDVFVALVRVLPAFEYQPGRSFRAWLATVFTNKLTDRRRKRVPVPLAVDESTFPMPAVEGPAAELEEAEYRAVLVARAAKLVETDFQPSTWKAFWATAVEGRPVAEVADELGLRANAVYLARSRVLARLREELRGLLE